MSEQNVFTLLATILSGVVLAAALFAWKPETNPFLFLNWTKHPTATMSRNEKNVGASTALVASANEKTPGAVWDEKAKYWVYVVRYDSESFSPRFLVIDRGDNVRFVNTSKLSMRMEINLLGEVDRPANFMQENVSGENGTYQLSFTQPGVWSFDNLNGDKQNNGIIYVRDNQNPS